MLDVTTLDMANERSRRTVEGVTTITWTAEAHGVRLEYVSYDPDAEYWVSPIWTMREKGVALVDKSGAMVKNVRRDR